MSLLSQIARWLYILLIAYGFAALISTIIATVIPPLPAIAVGPLLCPAATTADVRSGRDGKYSRYQLRCVTADGKVAAHYSDSFQVAWATYWVVPVLLLGFRLTRPSVPAAKQAGQSADSNPR